MADAAQTTGGQLATPAATKRGGPSVVVLMLGLLVVLLLAANAAGIWWRMNAGGSAGAAGTSAGERTAPEPAGPPPPHVPTLAAPAANAAATAPLARVAGLAGEVEASLRAISPDGAAPALSVVQGGGRQADVSRGEIPRHQRWEIRFPPGSTLETYARQLDFFKIELAAIGVEDHVSYLSNLANPKPKVRPGFAADEQRLYLVWQRGAMREADEQLAARAGLAIAGKVLAHFIPAEIEEELVRLEDAYARQLNLTSVGKTVFGIRAAGDNFRFYVIQQQPDLR